MKEQGENGEEHFEVVDSGGIAGGIIGHEEVKEKEDLFGTGELVAASDRENHVKRSIPGDVQDTVDRMQASRCYATR